MSTTNTSSTFITNVTTRQLCMHPRSIRAFDELPDRPFFLFQAKAAAAFVKRRPTDVALVLSVINSAVLLALLGGLSGAGYLAKTGRLESALLTFGGPHSAGGSSSSAQAFFALVSAAG